MKARTRSVPRGVVLAWGASMLAGALQLAAGPMPTATAQPQGLSPATLTTFLAQAVPAGATDVRVNGLYGSGRGGAWEVIGHLTWRHGGSIDGGAVLLPSRAGRTDALPLAAARLASEHRLGWPLRDVHRALDSFPDSQAALAMLELEIQAGEEPRLLLCSQAAGRAAVCVLTNVDGDRSLAPPTSLEERPDAGVLGVRRTS